MAGAPHLNQAGPYRFSSLAPDAARERLRWRPGHRDRRGPWG